MPKRNIRRRLISFNIFFLVLMLILSARLAYIQISGHEELSEAAARQQRVRIEGADARGIIYDRNMAPLTGNNQDYVYIINRKTIEERGRQAIERYNARRISNSSREYEVYTFSEFNIIADEILRNEYNAYVMRAERRYDDNQIAAHIVGYVKELEGSGASGVELAFNDVLSERRRQIYASADALGKIIPGIGLSSNVENGNIGIVTTLEINLQREVERILEECEKNGAIVVLDSQTGQVLAASSTPAFNPNRIKDYINSENAELVNKVTQGEYPPGSIFKIIVAAAALEYKVKGASGNTITLNSRFLCEGSEELHGIQIRCFTGGEAGHGEITLIDAFAKSCNSAFIQLGELTGGKEILQMCKALGLGEIALGDIGNEKAGNLMREPDTAGAGIGNLSIGQGSMLITPVQAARMTNIIANKGVDKGVALLMETDKTEKRAVSRATAELIEQMMIRTMTHGTGNNITTSAISAGKTGSAESSMDGVRAVHGWFTGYFPAGSRPEYTIAVFVEDGRSGRGAALPLFKSVEEYLVLNPD
jgi:peptidoglycan glycosyltransferase/penicillin-binding protein 2